MRAHAFSEFWAGAYYGVTTMQHEHPPHPDTPEPNPPGHAPEPDVGTPPGGDPPPPDKKPPPPPGG